MAFIPTAGRETFEGVKCAGWTRRFVKQGKSEALILTALLEHVLQVVILRKETFYIHFETESLKDQILHEFQECQEAGATMGKY